MPDLRMRHMSGRTLMATVVVLVGIAAVLVALLSSVGPLNRDEPRPRSTSTVIEPVAPIDPDDDIQELRKPKDQETVDPNGPFAESFGKSVRRNVTIQVSGDGSMGVSVTYRDGKESDERVVTGEFTTSRTFKGRYPMAAVTVQLPENAPGGATRGTCAIAINGVEVTKQTTTRPDAPTICVY
jgi:hypothetical protein